MQQTVLQRLLIHELSDLYSAEKQVLSALEKAVDQLADQHLKNILAHHIKETEIHITRLEHVAGGSTVTMDASHLCKGMQGIILEASQTLLDFTEPAARDAAFVLAARKMEHYEIAAYASVIVLARYMEETQIVSELDQTMQEEREADNKLMTMAEESLLKKIVAEV